MRCQYWTPSITSQNEKLLLVQYVAAWITDPPTKSRKWWILTSQVSALSQLEIVVWARQNNFEKWKKMEKNGTRQEKSTLRSRNSHLKEVDEVTSNIKSPAPSSSLLTNYTLPNKRGNFRPQKKTSRRHLLCLSPLKQQAGLHISWPKYLIHDTLTPIIVAIPPSASLV